MSNSVDDEDVKHMNWLEEELGKEYDISKIIVNSESHAYTRKDSVHVIPAGMMGL